MLFSLSLLGIVRQMLFHLIDLVYISRVIAWIYNSDGSGQIPTWNLTRAKKTKNQKPTPEAQKIDPTYPLAEMGPKFSGSGKFWALEFPNITQIYPITSLISKLTSKIVRGHHHESSLLNESNFHQFWITVHTYTLLEK